MRGLGLAGAMPGRLVQILLDQQAAAANQTGLTIPEILAPDEMAFMQQVWPQVRVAAQFSHINWSAHGFPNGPNLNPVSYAAMAYVWPNVRVAADFSHPRWDLVPVPLRILQAAMPVPEVPSAPAPVTPTTTPTGPTDPAPAVDNYPTNGPLSPLYTPPSYGGGPAPTAIDEPTEETPAQTATVQKAGLFGGLSMPVMLALTAAGFLLFGKPKFPGKAPRRRRR